MARATTSSFASARSDRHGWGDGAVDLGARPAEQRRIAGATHRGTRRTQPSSRGSTCASVAEHNQLVRKPYPRVAEQGIGDVHGTGRSRAMKVFVAADKGLRQERQTCANLARSIGHEPTRAPSGVISSVVTLGLFPVLRLRIFPPLTESRAPRALLVTKAGLKMWNRDLYVVAIVALVGLLPTTASAATIVNLDGLGGPSEVFVPAIANKSATGFEQLGQDNACGGRWGVSVMNSLLMVNGWSGWSRDQVLEVAGPVTGLGSQVHLLKLTCAQRGESNEGSAGALSETFASALHESLAGASTEGFAGALSESFAGVLNETSRAR
jgi:hypothetical protein